MSRPSRRRILCAAVAAALLAGPAGAGPIIEFSTGSAGEGGQIVWSAGNGELWGNNIPIGSITISGAPRNNGTFAVVGPSGHPAGSLSFYTADFYNEINLWGCIPDVGVSVGGPGQCFPDVLLMSVVIHSWNQALMSEGLRDATGDGFLNDRLVLALGLENDQAGAHPEFNFLADIFSTRPLIPLDTLSTVNQSRISLVPAVPEPGTMILLGTGLLVAFRSGRRRTS